MTLAEMDARMGAYELTMWKARAQVDHFVEDAMRRRKIGREQAMEFARADHRTVMERKRKHVTSNT